MLLISTKINTVLEMTTEDCVCVFGEAGGLRQAGVLPPHRTSDLPAKAANLTNFHPENIHTSST